MKWLYGIRARLRLLFARRAAESRMDEELRFHIDMEADRLVREEHLAPGEARRRALVAFGGVQRHREELRDGRGLAWFSGLDLRLGIRMLSKYPGLTVVGVVGMGMAVAFAAVMFTLFDVSTRPVLPLPEGDRIVGIRTWDRRANATGPGTVHDFAAWRAQLKSMEELGAFRTALRNLILPDGTVEPLEVAEMTASAFRVTRVGPLLGRYIVDEDERPGAPRVVVIGHRAWRTHFGGDPAVIGQSLKLGATEHMIVGVMPQGFAFPVSHGLWTPLPLDPFAFSGGKGPAILVFGRLASGITRETAQAELTAIGRRLSVEFPATDEHREPRVVLFPALVGNAMTADSEEGGLYAISFLFSLLLSVICINVATLVYARTVTRENEIAVRVALGASRGRIIGQLFAEALVLSAAGSAMGLAVAMVAYRLMHVVMADAGASLPFWMPAHLSAGTVGYVVVLTLLAGVIIGVLPARHAVGRSVRSTLNQLSGATTIRLGKAWTVMIVAQVAVAAGALPGVVFLSAKEGWYSLVPPGFAAGEYQTARLEYSGTSGTQRESASQRGVRLASLERALESEPGVTGATFSSRPPGQEPTVRVEVQDLARAPGARSGRRSRMMPVAPDFFETFGVPMLAGRAFHSGDATAEAAPVIVNETFARELIGGGNVLGHRVRLVAYEEAQPVGSENGIEKEPWREIVGVVPNFPPNRMNGELPEARMYEPMALGEEEVVVLSTRLPSAPAAFGMRLRLIAMSVDPDLQLHNVMALDEVYRQGARRFARLAALMMALVTLSVLVLSAAGMYALMSFTVTRRRREIGIRSALGAHPRRLVASVLTRALRQLAIGAIAGMGVATYLDRGSGGELMGGHAEVLVPAVLVIMIATGCLAALGPARRSLRIQPAEALKAE